jgi:peptide/nickel transport system ATP-binding protein
MATPLLEVHHVSKVYEEGLLNRRRTVALDRFSLVIPEAPPRIITIAGESGSGKTTLARLVLGFLAPTTGTIRYRGRDIQALRGRLWQEFRRDVQAIFQDPFEVFNPFYRVDAVLGLVIRNFHLARDGRSARRLMEEALELVGLRPDEVLGKYPHELSGGQRQRIMIARACLLRPRLIVADEPVSMLDASLRAIILEIMLRLKREFGVSFLYITHDLSTAYQLSDELYILYRGRVVELGEVERVIRAPRHPYTQLLVSSIPRPNPHARWTDVITLPVEEELQLATAQGCPYVGRCPYAMPERCPQEEPPLYAVGPAHAAACFLYGDHPVLAGGLIGEAAVGAPPGAPRGNGAPG